MATFILIILLLLVVVAAMRFSYLVYPVAPIKVGESIAVFMDNSYNRTATVSENLRDGVVIYKTMFLPVHYRGRFYAVGYTEDAHKLIYTTKRKYMLLIRYAEAVRKLVGCPEYEDPTIEKDEEDGTDE